MTDADYTDDLALLTNAPAQVESQLHSLEQATGDCDLYVITNKTKFMCFKQDEAIFPLSGKPLKFVDQPTYLSRNISSAESGVNICTGKAWTAIDKLLIIWESDLSDKRKWDYSICDCVGCTTWTLKKSLKKK